MAKIEFSSYELIEIFKKFTNNNKKIQNTHSVDSPEIRFDYKLFDSRFHALNSIRFEIRYKELKSNQIILNLNPINPVVSFIAPLVDFSKWIEMEFDGITIKDNHIFIKVHKMINKKIIVNKIDILKEKICIEFSI